MKPSPTDKVYPVSGIATIVDAIEAEGVASLEALDGVHLSPPQLRSPETRISLSQVIQCYRNASQLSADPFFAYHAGLRFHVSTYGMYGFAILSSTDFRQAAHFAEQYHQLVSGDVVITFKEKDGYGIWTIEPAPLPLVDARLYSFIVELHFGIIVSLSRDIMGASFMPRELRVTYNSINSTIDRQPPNIFGCPVLFGRTENALVLDKQWLDGPAKLGNELTYLEVTKLCDQLMEEMHLRIGLAGSVREVLLINLAQQISFDAVAKRLKISTRTLKRKLRQEGTSYRKIVDGLRTQLAIKYLRDTELTIEEIASCLGFGDTASFRHAFRRWTKKTPGEFKRKTKIFRRFGS
jgi:AraC-like DNA-binding protein